MTHNENILLFSSDDWSSGLRSSKYHVAMGLSKTNRVLFVNSIGLRNPSASSKDLKRIGQKLKGFFRGWEKINGNLYVYTPLVIPFHGIAAVRKINRFILVAGLRIVQLLLGLHRPVLLVFSPGFHDVVGRLGEKGTIYYCIDELKGYRDVDAAAFEEMEKSLMAKADCLVACSRALAGVKKAYNPRTYYLPHGVDWALFRKALDGEAGIPADIAGFKKPVVGFYGFISEDWIDFELLNMMAARHPEWSIVLIGRSKLAVERVLEHPNIHFLGPRPFERLPMYNKAFDAGIIPFVINELTRSSNPLKLYEYLASGLPVVSVGIPEVAKYAELVGIAGSRDEFIALTERAIAGDSPEKRLRRSEAMRSETWEDRMERLSAIMAKHCAPRARTSILTEQLQ